MKSLKFLNCFIIFSFVFIPNVFAYDDTNVITTNSSEINDKCPKTIEIKDNLDFSSLNSIFNENGEFDFSNVSKLFEENSLDEIINASLGPNIDMNGNKYCPIYCVEDNVFNFPGYAPVANSGSHFTWTLRNDDSSILSGLTVNLQGKKVCTARVDLERWIEDYKKILETIDQISQTLKKPSNPPGRTCTPGDSTFQKNGLCSYEDTNNGPIVSRTVETTQQMLTNAGKLESNQYWQSMFGNMWTGAEGMHYNQSNMYWYLTTAYLQSDTTDNGSQQLTNAAVVCTEDDTGSYNCSAFQEGTFGGFVNGTLNAIGSVLTGDEITQRYVYEYKRHCCYWEFVEEKNNLVLKDYQAVIRNKNYKEGTDISGTSVNGQTNYVVYQTQPCPNGYNFTSDEQYCYGSKEEEERYFKGYLYEEVSRGEACSSGYTKISLTQCRKAEYGTRTKEVKDENKKTDKLYNYKLYKTMCCDSANGSNSCVGGATDGDGSWSTSGEKCVTTGRRTCPSGYRLSTDNFCYKTDTTELRHQLVGLLDLINELKNCKNVLKNFDYYLESSLELDYNETADSPNNYNTNGINPLSQTSERKGSSDIISGDKSSVTGSVSLSSGYYTLSSSGVPYTTCSWAGVRKYCTTSYITGLNEYWYDYYAKVYVAEYEYSMDNRFYRWVLLPSGKSQSLLPTGDYLKYNRFIDIGYANYPIHYATLSGLYEGLNIEITNVGYKNYLYNRYSDKINNYNNNLSDKYLANTQRQYQTLYDCYYEVKEGKPYCPSDNCENPGTVNIIYRPISLENPFPGMQGDGRKTGSNWCTLNDDKENCKNNETNENVKNYILNNRNTEGSSIYNKEPMYEITLTPALIKKIREYNENTNYDDYNLYCNGGTVDDESQGRECRSHFVVGGMDETNLPSMSSYFKTTCGVDRDFKACDKLDGYER